MSREARMAYWLIGLIVAGVLIHLLSAILLPFVAGMAVAYFLDPVADRLEAKGLSRALATTVITIAFFAGVAGVIAVLLPLLQHQVVGLVKLAPEVFADLGRQTSGIGFDLAQGAGGVVSRRRRRGSTTGGCRSSSRGLASGGAPWAGACDSQPAGAQAVRSRSIAAGENQCRDGPEGETTGSRGSRAGSQADGGAFYAP
ncbi:MAG TPA: hypothetical protein DC046_12660, partial [Rhodospirillaceae bacterium]|nr:hypothetical protein [Rhodospirillaceae bacterium]